MASLTLTQNDKLYNITFTVKNHNGNAVNLSDVTSVKFQVATQDDYTTLLSGDCVINDAANGKCSYYVQDGDFPTARRYYGMLQLIYSGGKIISTKRFVVIVEPEMA